MMFRFMHTGKDVLKRKSSAKVFLYLWEPNPPYIFSFFRNKPLSARLTGGDTGHISMGVTFSNGQKEHISIFPVNQQDELTGEIYKPIVNSKSLEEDIKAYRGIKPIIKTIEVISESIESALEKQIKELLHELEKNDEERAQWSIVKNCSHFISEILYNSGLINKTYFFLTPRKLFEIADQFEQDLLIQNIINHDHRF